MSEIAWFWDDFALWVSNGTAAGTYVVGGADNAEVSGANEYGLFPTNIAAFGDDVLFNGEDSSIGFVAECLWVSNGTAGGTYEVGGIDDAGVPGVNSEGLFPGGFFTFGDKALFYGESSTGTTGLWVTNGTTAGTFELGGLNNAGIADKPAFSTLSYTSIVSFGDKALFVGEDTDGVDGLWVTDGSSAGTVEVGGLGGKNISGFIRANYLTAVINGEAIFGDGVYLWVTNGTAAGTYEIGGSGNAGVSGDKNLGAIGSWAMLNGEMIFEAGDYLWTTDGTPSGTVEIGGIEDQGIGAYATGINAGSLTAFDNGVVFTGYASNGSEGLWFTNGTTAGTYEIGGLDNSGVTGAPLTGLLFISVSDDKEAASLGDEVVFSSEDAAGEPGLWVTNGTAAGTYEVGGLADTGVSGASTQGLSPTYLKSIGSKVFFSGDGTNVHTLWETDGTAADTYEVVSDGLPVTITGSPAVSTPVPEDLLGDGVSSMVWQNASSGAVYEWVMQAGEHVNNVYLGGLSGWSDLGSGNFYGSGTDGILWQNQSSGQVYEWSFAGGEQTGSTYLGNLSGWKAAAVGALDGAGTSDVVWQNEATGDVYEWRISGGQHSVGNDVYLGNLAGWSEIGAGDFNADGTTDMLWENNSSGAVYEWQFANGQHAANVYLGNLSGYTAIGSGDFTGDGASDLLWKSNTTGEVWEWEMNRAGQNGLSVDLGNLTGYNVASIGDFDGGGVDGIVWHGAAAGDTWLWTMTNGQHVGNTYLGNISGWVGH